MMNRTLIISQLMIIIEQGQPNFCQPHFEISTVLGFMMFEGVLITGAYLVCGLEAGVSDLSNRQLLVIGFLSRDNWSIGHQREVNPGVGHQVGLELGQIDVQSTVKSERSGDGRDNLANQSVQVGVGWPLNVEVSAADVVDGLIVDHEGAV